MVHTMLSVLLKTLKRCNRRKIFFILFHSMLDTRCNCRQHALNVENVIIHRLRAHVETECIYRPFKLFQRYLFHNNLTAVLYYSVSIAFFTRSIDLSTPRIRIDPISGGLTLLPVTAMRIGIIKSPILIPIDSAVSLARFSAAS